MKLRLLAVACVTLCSLGSGADVTAPAVPEVPYPDGYRQWVHICSAVTPAAKEPAAQGMGARDRGLIHHIYANTAALEGYRTGRFPDGSVLVADWFYLEKGTAGLVQGPRKSINVMYRDSRYADTGGWGFEDFDRDSHDTRNVGANARHACFECHAQAEDRGYVFSVLKP